MSEEEPLMSVSYHLVERGVLWVDVEQDEVVTAPGGRNHEICSTSRKKHALLLT